MSEKKLKMDLCGTKCKKCGCSTYGIMDCYDAEGISSNSPMLCLKCSKDIAKGMKLIHIKQLSTELCQVYVGTGELMGDIYVYQNRDLYSMGQGSKWSAILVSMTKGKASVKRKA